MRSEVGCAKLGGMVRIVIALLIAGTLGACSSQPDATATAKAPAPASATTNALAGTPMATYGHALNKAKNVQNVVDSQAKKQAKAIDEATGGGH